MLNHNVLVLNRSWLAVHVANVRRAVRLVYRNAARVVSPEDFATYSFEDWRALSEASAHDDETILRTVNFSFRVPDVIVLTFFNKYHHRVVPFSRRTLIERDNLMCQYCGRGLRRSNLTVDHVIPKSQGGSDTWENLVLACPECNLRKADRTPEQAQMPLLRQPRQPQWHPFAGTLVTSPPKPSWKPFLVPAHAEAACGD